MTRRHFEERSCCSSQRSIHFHCCRMGEWTILLLQREQEIRRNILIIQELCPKTLQIQIWSILSIIEKSKNRKIEKSKIYFCIVQISGLGKDIHSKGHVLRILRWRIRMIERIYTNSSVARFFLVHSTGSTPKHSCDKHTDSLVVALVSYLLD